jgi:hypothetical protein
MAEGAALYYPATADDGIILLFFAHVTRSDRGVL